MTNAAVASPENASATGAEARSNPNPANAGAVGQGTAGDATSQAAAGANGDGATSVSDPVREAAEKLADSMLNARVDARLAEIAAEQRVKAREGYHATSKEDVSKAFTDTVKAVTDKLTGPITIQVDDGNGGTRPQQIRLSADDIQKLVNDPLNGYHSTATEKYTEAVFSELADYADELLPNDAAREAFVAAADGKDPGEWLMTFASTQVLHSPLVESLLPEAADRDAFQKAAAGKPLATQLKELATAVDARIALEKAKSFTSGQGGVLGEPNAGASGNAAVVSIEGKTPKELAALAKEGKIDLAAEMRKLGAK